MKYTAIVHIYRTRSCASKEQSCGTIFFFFRTTAKWHVQKRVLYTTTTMVLMCTDVTFIRKKKKLRIASQLLPCTCIYTHPAACTRMRSDRRST